jgi:hypothetical protein
MADTNLTSTSVTGDSYIQTPSFVPSTIRASYDAIALDLTWTAVRQGDLRARLIGTSIYDEDITQFTQGSFEVVTYTAPSAAGGVTYPIQLRYIPDAAVSEEVVLIVYRESIGAGELGSVDFQQASGLKAEDLNLMSTEYLYAYQEAREVRDVFLSPTTTPASDSLLAATSAGFSDGTNYYLRITSDANYINAMAGATVVDFLFFCNGVQLNGSDYTYSAGVLTVDTSIVDPASDPSPNLTGVYLGNYLTGSTVADGAITNAKLADNSVSNAKMQDNSVDTLELVDGAVTAAKLAAGLSIPSQTDATVQGDGTTGSELSVATTPHTSKTNGAFFGQAPAAEGWEVFQEENVTDTTDNTFGIQAKSNGALTAPSARTFVEATTDVLLNIMAGAIPSGGAITVYVSDRAAAHDGNNHGLAAQEFAYDGIQEWAKSMGAKSTSNIGVQTIIPKGLFYAISVDSNNESGLDVLAYKFPFKHS